MLSKFNKMSCSFHCSNIYIDFFSYPIVRTRFASYLLTNLYSYKNVNNEK